MNSDAKGVAPFAALFRLAEHEHLTHSGVASRVAGLVETRRDRHERPRASVCELQAELGRRVGRIDCGDNPTEQRDGVERDRVLRQVGAVNREDVPLAKASRSQPGCGPIDGLDQSGVRQRPACRSVDERRLVASCGRAFQEERRQRHLRNDDIRLRRAENHRDILSGLTNISRPEIVSAHV